jgi:hypothetical protein
MPLAPATTGHGQMSIFQTVSQAGLHDLFQVAGNKRHHLNATFCQCIMGTAGNSATHQQFNLQGGQPQCSLTRIITGEPPTGLTNNLSID